MAPRDSAVNVAFPAIAADLGLAVTDIRWVIVCYVITYAALLVAFGSAGDRHGHRRVFLLGLIWSLFSLTLCATAESPQTLLAARMLQGVGAALVLGTGAALATHSAPASAQAAAVSVYMLAFALATAAGPLLGGVVLQHWGWPAVFWFRIPLALMAAALVMWTIPRSAPGAAGGDVAGGVMLAGALVCLLLLVSQAGQGQWPAWVLALLGGGAVLGIGRFRRRQSQASTRTLDLSVFARPGFTMVNVAHVGVNGASFMVMLLAPFHLAERLGGAGGASGALFALSPLAFVLASPVAGRLLRRAGPATIAAVGAVLNAAGLAAVAMWPSTQEVAWLAASLLTHGFGYGLFQVACLNHVMASLPRREHGVAGSLNMLTRTVGVVSGVAAGTLAFAAAGGGGAEPGSAAFGIAFSQVFLGATVVVLAMSVLLALSRR